jgi:phage gp16-like protein
VNTSAAHEIRLIQIGRSALQLDDDTYRALLANLTGGKTSSKALTGDERQAVLQHMKARGFVVKPRADAKAVAQGGWQRDPQLRKLRAMWYVLADAGELERPEDMDAANAAIEKWARRLLAGTIPLDALRFATGPQMDKLIEAMKAWHRRVGVAE